MVLGLIIKAWSRGKGNADFPPPAEGEQRQAQSQILHPQNFNELDDSIHSLKCPEGRGRTYLNGFYRPAHQPFCHLR